MNIQLNVELTDEQYDALMAKSYDKVFEGDEITDALRAVIVTKMSEYIKEHPQLLDDYFRPKQGYFNERKWDPAVVEIVKEAATEATNNIKEAIYKMIIGAIKDPKADVENLVLSLMTRAIMDGVVNGMHSWMKVSAGHQQMLLDILRGSQVIPDIPDVPDMSTITGLQPDFDGTKVST